MPGAFISLSFSAARGGTRRGGRGGRGGTSTGAETGARQKWTVNGTD